MGPVVDRHTGSSVFALRPCVFGTTSNHWRIVPGKNVPSRLCRRRRITCSDMVYGPLPSSQRKGSVCYPVPASASECLGTDPTLHPHPPWRCAIPGGTSGTPVSRWSVYVRGGYTNSTTIPETRPPACPAWPIVDSLPSSVGPDSRTVDTPTQ